MSPAELLRNIDVYCRAASDLSVGQIDLKANPPRAVPFEYQHIAPRLLGPWGRRLVSTLFTCISTGSSTPTYVNMIYIFGPDHGGQGRRADQIAVLTEMRARSPWV